MVDFLGVPRAYSAEDYPQVYERWTRHQKVAHETESVLEVWATLKSRDYREAFVARYAADYSLNAAARDQLMQSQREAADSAYEFLITAQSANYRWNDLEKKNSPWRVTLVDGAGNEMAPDQLKVEKLPDMFEREFFPVKTPFTKTYSAHFPRVAGKDEVFARRPDRPDHPAAGGPLGPRRPAVDRLDGQLRPAAPRTDQRASCGLLSLSCAAEWLSRSSNVSTDSRLYRSASRSKKSDSTSLKLSELGPPLPSTVPGGGSGHGDGGGRIRRTTRRGCAPAVAPRWPPAHAGDDRETGGGVIGATITEGPRV